MEYSKKAMGGIYLEADFARTRSNILSKLNTNTNIESKNSSKFWEVVSEYLEMFAKIIDENKFSTMEEAGYSFKNIPTKEKNLTQAYYNKAVFEYRLGYNELAKSDIKQALEYSHKNDVECIIFATSILKEDILDLLTRGILLSPNNHDLHFKRATYYYDKKKYEEAYDDLLKCVEINSNDATSYAYIGVIKYYIHHDKKKALEMYNKALSIDPKLQIAKEEKNKLLYGSQPKYDGIDRRTKSRIEVTATLINIMKDDGFIKKISQNSGVMTFFVDENMWYNSFSDGILNTIEIAEEYSLLRGCKISDFKSSKTGKLILRHRAIVHEIP